ncbi:Mucin-19 [Streptomyces sp. H10-C2]|uniref:Mucin-19 n=1 Tax=unclassified Streptomyces TaxID=2593676 RepID=UPI0024B9CDE7|nr:MULTISPECIES: Mucin-19 [unclassified Streptomyces]MDJ0346356.1 Mucin-19 [Streptomyces sp. PH10-H1]MDJ0374954.1 Mucin-19 [Streptomyces sp. H10-C2]
MDAKAYTASLAELRRVRDDIKKAAAALAKLTADRDKRVAALGTYAKASADKLAPAAGLAVIDVVALVPSLGPSAPVSGPDTPSPAPARPVDHTAPQAPAQTITATGAVVPDLRRPEAPAPAAEVVPEVTDIVDTPAPPAAVVTETDGDDQEHVDVPATAAAVTAPAQVAVPEAEVERELPSIPAGPEGDRWCAVTPNLASTRPNFTQQPRAMAFLDTTTGVLVHRDQTVRVQLGAASVAEILAAVYAVLPASVERIYITAGDPWHADAARHPFLRDAVAAWLNAPPGDGWTVEASRGKDRMAGHLVHPRNPVGRWQRGDQHTEIRSVGEWFEVGDADPATVRDAFVELWKALKIHWSDVTLMGSPSQTGRDLWTRTIPAKTGAKWADGYPVMSEEIRGLLHATAGQGRTELILPPHVPEQLPRLVELDRTFAYAKHTWASGVGAPRRITPAAFAAMSDKDKTNALYAPSHWQVRVTVPDGWEHVGILPAPAAGDRAWEYPSQGGRTFVTWAGGAELNVALNNAIAPWRIEILDGLVWQSGDPLKAWSKKLKDAWSSLQAKAAIHGDERQREAARLASRGIRSILLYGIGGFAQRPRIVTGTVPVGQDAPDGAQIIGIDGDTITWQKNSGFSRDPNAHPEWAAGVWSGARAALLSTRMREDDVSVGALHLPARSVVAFRTDAIYTTADVTWPYHGNPGDYLKKGHIPWELAAPRTEDELLSHQAIGREALAELQEATA